MYKPVGENAQDAVAAQQWEINLLATRETASVAGVKLVEEPGRKYLRRVIERYKLDRENQGAMEAREQAELAGKEFLLESGKTFVDEVTKVDVYRFHRALRDRKCAARIVANMHARLKCGLREQELVFLEWPDIDQQDKVLRVQSKPERGFRVKDAEEREVSIPNDLLDPLLAYKEKYPAKLLVLGTDTDKPNTDLLRTLKQLGVYAEVLAARLR